MSSNFTISVLCVFGFTLSHFSCQVALGSPPQRWALQELLKKAVENSPTITKARQEKFFAELEEKKAKSLYWPRLRIESSHGLRNQDPAPLKPSESSAASLILSQNLWNEGIDAKKIALARLQKRRAELLYFQLRDDLCLRIAQEFYRYSSYVKTLEVQKNQQKLIKRQFDLISGEYLQGLRSRRDFLRFKSQVQRSDLDLQRQMTLIERSRLNLIALAGLPDDSMLTQFQPEESPPPLLDLFKNPVAMEKTYEGQLLAISLEQYDFEREIADRQIDPTLNFDLRAALASDNYWNTQTSFADRERRNWSAFLIFNWTLWDGGEISSRKAQVKVRNEIQQTELQQKKIDLEVEIQKLQVQFDLLKKNFKISEELLILEQNNFHFLESEYRQSKTTYLDFMNGVKDLAESQNRHWSNLFDLKQGLVLYHYYKGSIFRFLMNDVAEVEDHSEEDQ